MKKCPECGAVNGDYDLSCRVCGASLSGVVYEDLDKLADAIPPPTPKTKLHSASVVIVIATIALWGLGSYEVAVQNGFGFILIDPGRKTGGQAISL